MRESQHKRLTRSGSDRMIAGVFGGIGQYFKIQPNILRITICLTDYFYRFCSRYYYLYYLVIIMPADPQNPIY